MLSPNLPAIVFISRCVTLSLNVDKLKLKACRTSIVRSLVRQLTRSAGCGCTAAAHAIADVVPTDGRCCGRLGSPLGECDCTSRLHNIFVLIMARYNRVW